MAWYLVKHGAKFTFSHSYLHVYVSNMTDQKFEALVITACV
jgi:hypothetical protein